MLTAVVGYACEYKAFEEVCEGWMILNEISRSQWVGDQRSIHHREPSKPPK